MERENEFTCSVKVVSSSFSSICCRENICQHKRAIGAAVMLLPCLEVLRPAVNAGDEKKTLYHVFSCPAALCSAVGLFVGFFVLPPAVEEEHNKGTDDDDGRHSGPKRCPVKLEERV